MLFITNNRSLFTQSYFLGPYGWLPALYLLNDKVRILRFSSFHTHIIELRGSELYTRDATENELEPSQTQALASTLFLERGDPQLIKQRVLLPHFVLMMLQSFSLHFAIHQHSCSKFVILYSLKYFIPFTPASHLKLPNLTHVVYAFTQFSKGKDFHLHVLYSSLTYVQCY